MKILLVGGGGREHALAAALTRENTAVELLAAPGNPGIAQLARCIAVSASAVPELVALAVAESVHLVVVGPEAPLADGLVDRLRQAGIPAFGPTAAAAEIETSKQVAKELMTRSSVPTARAEMHSSAARAHDAVRERFPAPVVIKASGLAAGKGVIVCATDDEAHAAIDRIMGERAFGDAGNTVLVEAFMAGEELSLFALSDGTNVLPMLPAQDHKRLLNGDTGPNTGGMGAYAPVSLATPELVDNVIERILLPTLHGLRQRDSVFTGLLYAGLMLTDEGPQVVEFNCRFGDPETQAILPLLESSLLDPMLAIARGASVGNMAPLQWKPAAAVTTVVAAPNYPASPRTGTPLTVPDDDDGLRVFHAGTRVTDDGTLVSSGGRVVAVTGIADTFAAAQARSAAGADAVQLDDRQLRTDIGWREQARLAGNAE